MDFAREKREHASAMNKAATRFLLLAVAIVSGCTTAPVSRRGGFSHFVGLAGFSKFARTQNESGESVLLSPEIKSRIAWNELIVSWDADAEPGTDLKVEASAISRGHRTRFYTLGSWSPDNRIFPRTSVRGQDDADGRVDTDTLILTQTADAVQIRLTLGGTHGARPSVKFLGISFSNTQVPPAIHPPN